MNDATTCRKVFRYISNLIVCPANFRSYIAHAVARTLLVCGVCVCGEGRRRREVCLSVERERDTEDMKIDRQRKSERVRPLSLINYLDSTHAHTPSLSLFPFCGCRTQLAPGWLVSGLSH